MNKPPPTIASLNILGVILWCHQCGRRRVKEHGALPQHETIASIARKGRCHHCGRKGCEVEVLNRLRRAGASYGRDMSREERAHLDGLKTIYHGEKLRSRFAS